MLIFNVSKLVAERGFEPRLGDYGSPVRPLHYSAIFKTNGEKQNIMWLVLSG